MQGVTPDLFYGSYSRNDDGRLVPHAALRDCLSVYGAIGPMDVNTVQPAVMQAIGIAPDIAAALVALRKTAPIRGMDQLAAFQSSGPAMGRLGFLTNSIMTLRATARSEARQWPVLRGPALCFGAGEIPPRASGSASPHSALVRQRGFSTMIAADFNKWLAIGSGVGIEIGREDLTVTVVRVRPSGARILGELIVPRFREQAAGEWGATYTRFLKKLGFGHLAATALLPRDELTVRQVSLPGVSDKDMAAAVRFEIDALNPYAEEEVAYDWARIGRTSSILIGITRRATLDGYTALFSQAGIKVASFTFSAAAIYSAARLHSNPPSDGFVALEADRTAKWRFMAKVPPSLCSRRVSTSPSNGCARWLPRN